MLYIYFTFVIILVSKDIKYRKDLWKEELKMKHYEITIKVGNKTFKQKFLFAKNEKDVKSMVEEFMHFNYQGVAYQITNIRELNESEVDFGF